MTNNEIQEFNRRKIICAVHNTEDYEEALEKEWSINYKTTLATRNAYCGESATLSRVLLALKHKQIGFYDSGLIEVIQTNGYYKEDYNHHICDWDLTLETLEQQSLETQISIAKLLGYELKQI